MKPGNNRPASIADTRINNADEFLDRFGRLSCRLDLRCQLFLKTQWLLTLVEDHNFGVIRLAQCKNQLRTEAQQADFVGLAPTAQPVQSKYV
jgi:hypothetical protein